MIKNNYRTNSNNGMKSVSFDLESGDMIITLTDNKEYIYPSLEGARIITRIEKLAYKAMRIYKKEVKERKRLSKLH